MSIQFNCVQCNKAIETPDDSAGKQCRCPDCGQVMPIPDPEVPIGQSFDPGINLKNLSEYSSNPYMAPPAPSIPPYPPSGPTYVPIDRSGLVLGLGIASIVVSLSSCTCCLILFPVSLGLGIPAWVMGRNDLRAIASGQRHPGQEGMLRAGMICGMVGVGIATLFMLLSVGSMFL